METQQKQHPSALHLAALALGKLKPDTAANIQSHLTECADCRRFVSDTPRAELAEIIKQSKHRAAAEQNTMATGFSGTVASLQASQPGASPATPPSLITNPVIHAVVEGEIPGDLFAQSKYRILRVLGRGGMGTVYEAQHVRMDRRVAIKVINPEIVDHPQALLRFEKEIQAVASLDHANIARAFDAEPIGSLQAFVMEFVRGQTLYDFLKSRGRLSVVDACRCVRQALVGLQHAHEQGLVHRDLKPQNLMLTRDTGQIKILDFGLAKAVSENRQSLTNSGATMGTYAYLAPEQALDASKADIRADIYSLGCTLYLLVSGVLPFVRESDTALLLAHQNETPRPLKEICPEVPEALSDLVARMLAKDPADRPQTPREAAEALLPFARGKSDLSPAVDASGAQPAVAGRSSNGWTRIGVGAAILALLGFGSWAAGLFSVRTAYGTIIVDGVPSNADVSVDDQTINVNRNSDSLTISAVAQGPHHLKLVQGGHEIWSDDVELAFTDQLVRVKFERSSKTKSGEIKDGNGKPTPDINRTYPDPEVKSGRWEIEGDELVQTAANSGKKTIIFGDPSWSEYDMSFTAMSDGPQGFITVFHKTDKSTYQFEWGGWGNKATDTNFWINGKFGRHPGNYHRRSIEFHRWYNVDISIRGSQFKCSVDGEVISSDSNSRFTNGRVGFLVWNGTAHFKDIVVRSPDGKLLWHGLPQIPVSTSPSSSSSNKSSAEVRSPDSDDSVSDANKDESAQ